MVHSTMCENVPARDQRRWSIAHLVPSRKTHANARTAARPGAPTFAEPHRGAGPSMDSHLHITSAHARSTPRWWRMRYAALCIFVVCGLTAKSAADDNVQIQDIKLRSQELTQKADEILALSEQREKLNTDIKTQEAEYQRLRYAGGAETQTLRDQIDILKNERQTLTTSITESQKQLSGIQAKIAAASGEYSDVNQKLAGIKADLEKLLSTGATGLEDVFEIQVGESRASQGNVIAVLQDGTKCTVEIRLKDDREGDLESNGVRSVALRGEDGRVIPLMRGAANDFKRRFATWTDAEICKYNRATLTNHEQLSLVVDVFDNHSKVPLQAVYRMKYQRQALEWELSVNTYFGSSSFDSTAPLLAAFPALQFGFRRNLPFGTQNPDFHIAAHALIGGGFAFPTENDSSMPAREHETLTLFVGAATTLGRYIGVGYAYDFLNHEHFLLLTPGSVLSQAMFKF